MREQYIEYRDGDALLEGFLCYDESQPGPRPTVLINHAWGGRDDFVERKARRLAWQGYACFALDNFGKGKRGTTNEECSALMTPFMKDRAMLLRRLQGRTRHRQGHAHRRCAAHRRHGILLWRTVFARPGAQPTPTSAAWSAFTAC